MGLFSKDDPEAVNDTEEESEDEEEQTNQLVCPYCTKTLEEPLISELDDDDGNTWCLCGCEHCKKVLGTHCP